MSMDYELGKMETGEHVSVLMLKSPDTTWGDLHIGFSIMLFHPSYNTYFSSGEIFKPLQYQNDKLVSCHVVTNSMKILKNHEKSCSKIAFSSS